MKISKSIIVACALFAAASAWAIPAQRTVYTMTQPDGTEVQLTKAGDEYCHYYLTDDDRMVMERDGGYYYAATDSNGNLIISDVLACNSAEQTAAQVSFLQSLSAEKLDLGLQKRRSASPLMLQRRNATAQMISEAPADDDLTYSGVGLFPYTNYPTKGEVHGLVILVEYKDVQFSKSHEEIYDYFNRMLNEPGFSDLNATGSAYDYFQEASSGQFDPKFDIIGPITLPYVRSYYGKNDTWGNDMNPYKMYIHAADTIVARGYDISKYDNDNDGIIDNAFIFYAGLGEAASNIADTVWPHSWRLNFALSNRNGYKPAGTQYYFNSYACGSELIGSSGSELDGIGTFVHEFSHVMGLPDLYNTANASSNATPNNYDVMDVGPYNNNSRTPPTYSAFERNALGWLDAEVIDGNMDIELEHILTSNKAYVLPTAKDTEYFIFENRQQAGSDKYIPYHGMLVWHIDYVPSVWDANVVNNTANHQYVDILEASGVTGSTSIALRRYPFPGAKKITELSYASNKNFASWAGEDLGYVISDIKESNGVITAKVTNPAGIGSVIADNGVKIKVNGREVSVEGADDAVITDIMGRMVARGLQMRVPTAGIYLVTADGVTKKISIR